MARLEPEGECMVFTGSRLRSGGYGQVSGPGNVPLRAHRVVWEHHHGPIPKGAVIMHSCDNPPCCRIDHLELGTYSQNLRDAIARGLNSVPPGRKGLPPEVVQAIRAAPTGMAAVRATGVSQSHVSRIRNHLVY